MQEIIQNSLCEIIVIKENIFVFRALQLGNLKIDFNIITLTKYIY